MANPPKQQGTRRETMLVEEALERGFHAQRSPNNHPSRDVDITVGSQVLRVESKDRQRLSVHKTVHAAEEANEGHPSVLYWHRYIKKKGNTRRTSMGSVWCVPDEVMWSLLEHAAETGWEWDGE